MTIAAEADAGAVAGRVFESTVGAFELLAVHLGKQLGLYDVLAAGPVTPGELAGTAGIHPRYAREWLEQQTIAGLLDVSDPADEPDERSYRLPPATAAVLVEETSLAYLAPLAAFVAALGSSVPDLIAAYRTGGGVSYGDFGTLVRDAQAALNRPWYEAHLADWVATGLPDVHARLSSTGGRIADLGCGCGWSTAELARIYPKAIVEGIDNDRASIADARRNAAGLPNVRFTTGDAADPPVDGSYDLVCILEALHDMPRPVETLTVARKLLAPGGAVLVMDERVADAFGAVGDLMERFMYVCSVVHCLPVGMADQPSAGTGTVMRTSTLGEYAAHAGLTVTVLPIEHDCWRFYRLDPA